MILKYKRLQHKDASYTLKSNRKYLLVVVVQQKKKWKRGCECKVPNVHLDWVLGLRY